MEFFHFCVEFYQNFADSPQLAPLNPVEHSLNPSKKSNLSSQKGSNYHQQHKQQQQPAAATQSAISKRSNKIQMCNSFTSNFCNFHSFRKFFTAHKNENEAQQATERDEFASIATKTHATLIENRCI
ncbi:hypothetical protein ACKWTF_014900 [Chironomus riparius]